MKVCLYYKFDFIKDAFGHRFNKDLGNQDILSYHSTILDKLKDYSFDAYKARPRSWNFMDTTIPMFFLEHLRSQSIELWYHAKLPDQGGWSHPTTYEFLYQDPVTTRLLVKDEPKTYFATQQALTQYNFLRGHEITKHLPIMTALIGEAFTNAKTDPYDNNPDYRTDYCDFVVDMLQPDYIAARHYPLRRHIGHIDRIYKDKMNLDFTDFLEELYYRGGSGAVPILQGFGQGDLPVRDNYWRMPTKSEMDTMLKMCEDHGFEWVAVFAGGQQNLNLQLMDQWGNPQAAMDGSYPIDSFLS